MPISDLESPTTPFSGFPREVFRWFGGLEKDNSRAYFARSREFFELDIKGAFTAMLRTLAAQFDGEVYVARQHRDLRFTADKTPYKTRTYGGLSVERGRLGLYSDLSSAGLYAGTGYHRLARDQLDRFRRATANPTTGAQLEAAARAAFDGGLELVDDRLKNAPRGYARAHPRIAWLQQRSVIIGKRLPPGQGIGDVEALDHVATAWRQAEPLRCWLEANVGPSTEPPRRRFSRAQA